VAYLLLGELGDGPHLIFRTIWAISSPLGDDFWKRLRVIFAHGRDTLFCEYNKLYTLIFLIGPPLLDKSWKRHCA